MVSSDWWMMRMGRSVVIGTPLIEIGWVMRRRRLTPSMMRWWWVRIHFAAVATDANMLANTSIPSVHSHHLYHPQSNIPCYWLHHSLFLYCAQDASVQSTDQQSNRRKKDKTLIVRTLDNTMNHQQHSSAPLNIAHHPKTSTGCSNVKN